MSTSQNTNQTEFNFEKTESYKYIKSNSSGQHATSDKKSGIFLSDEPTVKSENKSGLKHGQFRTGFKEIGNGETNTRWEVINPLTQEELAEGWRVVLPNPKSQSTIHHFNVYKSQLPFYLWKKLRSFHNADHEEEYEDVQDRIYTYSVKYSKYDDLVTMLGRATMLMYPDLDRIRELYNELEQHRVKGWVMIRARTLLGM